VSAAGREPLGATASRVDAFVLLEYRGVWAREAVAGSGLTDDVKAHLQAQAAGLPNAKLLLVRRPERRDHDGYAVFVARPREGGGTLVAREVREYPELLDLDLTSSVGWDAVSHPFLLVCTHGKHDRCCARRGRPLYQALREQVDPDWLWQTSHVGGDRFAGNVVCPREGLYFGRVRPEDVFPVLDEYLAGRIHLARYRGRSLYTFPAQAAEIALRAAGHAGIEDVALAASARDGAGWRIRFRTPAGEREVAVEAVDGDLTYLTCHADALRHPRRYVAT
jgi:hypothetical protein